MKKLIVLLVFTTNFLYAQNKINIGVKKSEIVKAKKRNNLLSFSKNDGNGGLIVVKTIYSGLRLYPKAYLFEHYNADLKLIKSVEMENTSKNIISEVIVNKNNTINVIVKRIDKDSKDIIYSILSASINDFKFKSKELYTFTKDQYRKIYWGSGQLDGDSHGAVILSKNNNYTTISFDIKNKENEEHLFVVFDKDFNKLYDTTFKSNIADKYFDFQDVDISDKDGTLFILGKIFENNSKKTKKNGKTNYHYELYKLTADKQQRLNIKENDKFVGSLHLIYENNNLVLAGFYSDKNDYRYRGVCRYDLNDDLTVKNNSFQPFSNQFFEDKYKKGAQVKSKKKELRNLSFRSVFLDKKGNIIINAEEFYITQYYVQTQGGGGYWRTVYHYNDIITVKIDANGKLLWARNINKAQTNPANASFTAIYVNDKNYMFINTADKIQKISNNRIGFRQASKKKSNLFAIMIDENGTFSYKKIIDDKDSKVWYEVSEGIVDEEENSIIFQGSKNKYKRILKLSIK